MNRSIMLQLKVLEFQAMDEIKESIKVVKVVKVVDDNLERRLCKLFCKVEVMQR